LDVELVLPFSFFAAFLDEELEVAEFAVIDPVSQHFDPGLCCVVQQVVANELLLQVNLFAAEQI